MNAAHIPPTHSTCEPPPPPPSPIPRASAGKADAKEHRPLTLSHSVARAAILAAVAGSVLTIIADVWQHRFYGRVLNDEPISSREADRLDLLTLSAYGVQALATLIAGICFLSWFFKAYSNLNDAHSTKHSPGWSIGSWVVPLLNLWRPMKIMEELVVEATRSDESSIRSKRLAVGRVWFWWIAFMVSWGFRRASTRVDLFQADGIRLGNIFSIVDSALFIVAGLFILPAMAAITEAQTRRKTGAPIEAPSSPPSTSQRQRNLETS